jgi:hypothetical protein
LPCAGDLFHPSRHSPCVLPSFVAIWRVAELYGDALVTVQLSTFRE